LRRDHPEKIENMFVYILFSEKRSRFYVDHTANIIERLKRHNQGRVLSTKTGVPWELVLQIEV
jgi:putative endonuclease